MASNEGHIHWAGGSTEQTAYLNQPLTIALDEVPGDPIGTLRVRESSYVGAGTSLPNSTAAAPAWSTVPGTAPALEVRQDGHWSSNYIEIRQI